jgi:hypothetical protein
VREEMSIEGVLFGAWGSVLESSEEEAIPRDFSSSVLSSSSFVSLHFERLRRNEEEEVEAEVEEELGVCFFSRRFSAGI